MKLVLFSDDLILLKKIEFAVRGLVDVVQRPNWDSNGFTGTYCREFPWVIDGRDLAVSLPSIAREADDLVGRNRFLLVGDQPTMEDRLACVRSGALDCVPAATSHRELRTVLAPLLRGRTNPKPKPERSGQFNLDTFIVGTSKPTASIRNTIRRLSKSECTVVVTGESGSGKELVARAVHQLSSRKKGPFVPVNCAAVPSALFEAEFFGVTRGAYTGAVNRDGLFQRAHGGTLFLDEIGELPLENQAKLLRIIETGEVTPLGSTQRSQVDVRLVCATNRPLSKMVQAGEFRADLYYRLNTAMMHLLPLRSRREDIVPIATAILAQIAPKPMKLTPDAVSILEDYGWPGNVRELQHVLKRALVFTDTDMIGPDSLMFDDALIND